MKAKLLRETLKFWRRIEEDRTPAIRRGRQLIIRIIKMKDDFIFLLIYLSSSLLALQLVQLFSVIILQIFVNEVYEFA